jgi:hypothetical protein
VGLLTRDLRGISASSFGCSSSNFVMLAETLLNWSVSALTPTRT